MRVLWMLFAASALAACTSGAPELDRLACNSCHGSEYDRTLDDAGMSHADKGYPRTCYSCHGNGIGRPDGGVAGPDGGAGAWLPANADHCGFPIDEEPHAGWDCYTCHASSLPLAGATGAAIRDQITCTNCHWHDRARVDPRHGGGSVYDEDRCIRCHGRNRCP